MHLFDDDFNNDDDNDENIDSFLDDPSSSDALFGTQEIDDVDFEDNEEGGTIGSSRLRLILGSILVVVIALVAVLAFNILGGDDAPPDTPNIAVVIDSDWAPAQFVPANEAGMATGSLNLTGTTSPSATVQLVLDDGILLSTTADDAGNWQLTDPVTIPAGIINALVRATDAESQEVAEASVPTIDITLADDVVAAVDNTEPTLEPTVVMVEPTETLPPTAEPTPTNESPRTDNDDSDTIDASLSTGDDTEASDNSEDATVDTTDDSEDTDTVEDTDVSDNEDTNMEDVDFDNMTDDTSADSESDTASPEAADGDNDEMPAMGVASVTTITPTVHIASGGTTSQRLQLEGEATPNYDVLIFIDGEMMGTTQANSEGHWQYELQLPVGSYQLFVRAQPPANYTQDTDMQEIEVTYPQLVAVLENAGNFTILLDALAETDATSLLTEEVYTFFAPTDEAFRMLPEEILAQLSENPDILLAVLSNHMVVGNWGMTNLTIGDQLETIAGTTLTVMSSNRYSGLAVNKSTLVTADVRVQEGTLHVIDTVLLPAADAQPVVNTMGIDTIESDFLALNGTGDAGATIWLVLNDKVYGSTTIGEDGTWELSNEITEGEYEIVAYTLGMDGAFGISEVVYLNVR